MMLVREEVATVLQRALAALRARDSLIARTSSCRSRRSPGSTAFLRLVQEYRLNAARDMLVDLIPRRCRRWTTKSRHCASVIRSSSWRGELRLRPYAVDAHYILG